VEGIPVSSGKEILIADTEMEFAYKVIDYFSGRFDSASMTECGRNLIRENYTWEKVAEKYEEHYNNLIGQL
jgi:glycosyltransferase involved in cell wall biosynthesis